MKRIVIFTLYFRPEPTGIGPLATSLAEYLAEHQWEVRVITGFPNRPGWRVYEGSRGKLFQREMFGRVSVWRSWIYVPRVRSNGSMPAWQRILHDSSLTASSLPGALLGGKPDVVLSITPPLQLAASAIALNKLWRCPLLNWIQDIVPDAALNIGIMREGPALRLARKMENYVYRNADRLGIISEGFRANLAKKGVPPDKMILMPNWAEAASQEEPVDGDQTRAELGLLRGDFLLLHAGSIAAKQALENVVRAMKRLEPRREIHLLILGDGSRRNAIEGEAQRLGLERVRFMAPVSSRKHRELLRASDLLVLNQARDVVEALVPSKLLTYMPSGRPVIAAVNAASEAAHFVEASGGGVVVEPENPEAFATTVVQLQSQPEVRHEMGRRGNEYVRRNYGKAELLERFEATLRNLVHAAG